MTFQQFLFLRNKVQLKKKGEGGGGDQQIYIVKKDAIYFELDKQDKHFKMNVLKIILITQVNNPCIKLSNANMRKYLKMMKFNKIPV